MSDTIHVPVTFVPTGSWRYGATHEWECEHIVQTLTSFESVDEYREAVTGQPQPVVITKAMVCDHCGEVIEDE